MRFLLFLLVAFNLFPSRLWALPTRLPELLVNDQKERITHESEWRIRRQELSRQLQEHIFGFAPAQLKPRIEVRVETDILIGLYRDVRLHITHAKGEHEIRLALFLPKSQGRHPTILIINKCGNETVYDHEAVVKSGKAWLHPKYCFDKKGKEVGRGSHAEAYGVKQALAKGFAIATIAESDMSADSPEQNHVGLKGLFTPHMDPALRWGTLRTWAWGLSRAVDYLIEAPGVDLNRIITIGHSRRGKAALLAAALDERIAATIPHMSGLGGTAPLRCPLFRENAEMVSYGWGGYPLIGESEGVTHFFAEALRKYSRNIKILPVDTNALVALVAPRLVIDFQGTKDFWAGPKDSLKNIEGTAEVWQLLGADGNRPYQLRLPKGHHIGLEDWSLMLEHLLLSYNL